MIERFSAALKDSWRDWLPALLLAAAAFGLRLYFLLTYRYPMMLHEQDGVGYMEVARNLLALRPFELTIAPGYPVSIALFALLPLDFETVARVASIGMDALLLIPCYFLARRYSSPLGAVIACCLWGAFDFSLTFAPGPLAQSTYLFWLFVGALCLYRVTEEDGDWRIGALAGIAVTMAYLARPEGVLAMVWGAGLLGVACWRQRERWVAFGAYLAGGALLAAPWLVFLRVKTGIWTISSKAGFVLRGPDAFTTLGADGKVVGGGKGSDLSVWSSFYGSFEGFFTFVGHNLRDFTAIYRGTIPGWVVALAAVGLVLIVVRNGIRRSAVLMTLLLVLVPVVMVNAGRNQSYLYPLYAMTFFAAGAAIAIPVGWLQGLAGTARNRAAVLAVGLLCGLVLVAGYGRRSVANAHASYQDPALQEQVNFSTYVLRGAADVLRQASAPTDIFMCRWGLVSYFADRPTITLPKGGVEAVVNFGRANNARFIVVDTNSILSRRQELRELLNPLDCTPLDPRYGIVPIATFWHPAAGGYVVYRYVR